MGFPLGFGGKRMEFTGMEGQADIYMFVKWRYLPSREKQRE